MKPWEETWIADLERWEVRTPHVCNWECQPPEYHATSHELRLETDGGVYVDRSADRLRLIAAAPELYRALDHLAHMIRLTDLAGCPAAIREALHPAHAALAKARGEADVKQV